jgi:hypothetical protein
MTTRSKWLIAKLHSEGYCCLKGYLGFCAAKGETATGMAKNFSMSPDTIWYHQRRDKLGLIKCQKHSDCIIPIIEEITKKPD